MVLVKLVFPRPHNPLVEWAGNKLINNTIKDVSYIAKRNRTVNKEAFQLNRFDRVASELSETEKNNIRILRGWEKFSEPGRPEPLGAFKPTRDTYSWRLRIKPEGSVRAGLHQGNNLSRFDAKLQEGKYINPFNGETGPYSAMSHIPLENSFF